MNKKNRNKKKRQARIKKNIFNGVLIFVLLSLLVAVAFTASLYFYTMETRGTVVYPTTPLTKMMEQPYSYIADETLDITIQCPSIPVILSVGGTERNVSDNGCVFRYNSDLSISIYELEGAAFDILSTQFAPDLYNGSISGQTQYVNDLDTMDVGYFNGYPAEYQCGMVNVLSESGAVEKSIYVVTMVLDMGFDKDLMITVSTSNNSALYNAGILLESIGYTVVDTSLTTNTLDGATQLTSEPKLPEDDFKVTLEVEENVSAEVTVEQESWMDVQVAFTKDYEDGAVVVFQYTGTEVGAFDITLYDEEENEYAAANYSVDGLSVFVLDSAKKGNYTLKVPADKEVGTFNALVMSKEEYDSQYKGSSQPVTEG